MIWEILVRVSGDNWIYLYEEYIEISISFKNNEIIEIFFKCVIIIKL